MRLKRKLLAFILTCMALFTLTAAPAFAAEASRDSISVTGSAEEEVAPDMAVIYGTLEQKNPTAAEAREGLARQIQALTRELRLQLVPGPAVVVRFLRGNSVRSVVHRVRWRTAGPVPAVLSIQANSAPTAVLQSLL